MEETIKKSFGKAFRNLRELFEKDTPKEEIAARFFELGWKAGVENMNNSIAKAKSRFLDNIIRVGLFKRKRQIHSEMCQNRIC